MNDPSKEAALAIIQARSEALEPLYTELHARFAGSVANSQLISMQEKLMHDRANAALVRDVVEMLPDTRFMSTVPEAKLVLAHAVGLLYSRDQPLYSPTRPYYVVGRHQVGPDRSEGGVIELLLQPIRGDEEHPKVVRVRQDDMEARDARAAQHLATEEFSPEEMSEMYVRETGTLSISPHLRKKARRGGPYMETIVPRSYRQHNIEEIRRVTDGTSRGDETLTTGITDQQLVDFEVFRHLTDLASAFGVTQQVEHCMHEYMARSHTDPGVV